MDAGEVHAATLADEAMLGGGLGDMGAMLDMSAPQGAYQALHAAGGFLEPMEGMALAASRDLADYVLRHHELFSSPVEMGLGNVRPLIPLNVDPPVHSKYRKLLDPLFAPKRMDEQEADITRRVNALIDTFEAQGQCNFTDEFAEVFPSSVFLGLMGLPEGDLSMFLRLRDGILHPEKHDPAALTDLAAAPGRARPHRAGDLRGTSAHWPTSGRSIPPTT